MSFSCAPSELVAFSLETVSFSGQFGLSLSDLWCRLSQKLGSSTLDAFQQQIIWQWLFFSKSEDQIDLYATIDKKILPILPNYSQFIKTNGDEANIIILPTADTQWKYLTGLEASKKLKAQLGEKPFQLLCEISKHGSDGIISPDLCKATGQDPRSLPSRFKRLLEMSFIIRKNIYHEKTRQHTSLLIHSKFTEAKSRIRSEEFQSSRSTYLLRQVIVQSVRDAPNHLRGFNDLKRELHLGNNKSNSKFFGAIVEALHKSGYVEKLMVRSPEEERLVYSIRFLKDLPKDIINSSDYVDMLNSFESSLDDEAFEDKEDSKELYPLINSFYPIANQIHQQISSTELTGVTSKNIVTNISGSSGYRPWSRILDSMATFVVDGEKLVPIKDTKDMYNKICIIRAYDVEGKFKFYRYYTRDQYFPFSSSPFKSIRKSSSKFHDRNLLILNSQFFKSLGKPPTGDLYKSKKRVSLKQLASEASKRVKSAIKSDRSKRGRTSANDAGIEDVGLDRNESDTAFIIDVRKPTTLDNFKPIIPEFSSPMKRVRKSMAKPMLASSLKGQKRRACLLDIIRSLGGVTYTTARLRRLLDERLGNTTFTDNKTLARDISVLISSKILEVQNVSFERTGKRVIRKLLVLTEEGKRPSPEIIEQARQECLLDQGTKVSQPLTKRRVIDGEVTLYQESSRGKRKGRLDSLVDDSNPIPSRRKKKVVKEKTVSKVSGSVEVKSEIENASLPSLVSKKHRRKLKPMVKPSGKKIRQPRRFRATQKFDKNDATTLFRAVVISKTFTRGSIDFSEIANLFKGMDFKTIKQKWTVVRKSVGGLQAVLKGIESFEHIVLKGIEDELVSFDDLENVKFSFFLDLWKDMDSSILEITDKTPLYSNQEDNRNQYTTIGGNEVHSDIFEQLEDNSMRQKDSILSGMTFFMGNIKDSTQVVHDDLRTVLKAIFSTPEEKFSASRVKQVLSEYGDDATHIASSALIKDKEMIYYGSDDSNSRFVLTDKVYNTLNSKLSLKFSNQAAEFHENMGVVSDANKGLIISQNISNGQMASLLTLLIKSQARLLHVDRSYHFDGYESRLIDKEKLACDVILAPQYDEDCEKLLKVPVPTGKACSHIWLDLNGNINEQLWKKIINTILVYVHFRPGVPEVMIYTRMQPILSLNDFNLVLSWLCETKSLRKGQHDACWTNHMWFSTIGY